MDFFQKLEKIAVFPFIAEGVRSSVRQFNRFEKLIFFYDQSAFTLLFIASLFLHIFLGLTIGIISDLWVEVPPPIRARIGVSYAKLPSKPTLSKNSKPIIKKPVLQQLETALKPKLYKIVPEKPVVNKPALDNNLKNNMPPEPAIKETEVPRLKMSQRQITTKAPSIQQSPKLNSKALKNPLKPLLLPPDSAERTGAITNLPNLSKEPVPISPIRSRKSVLKPSQIELPKFSREEISLQKLKTPSFSKPLDLPPQNLPEISQPTLDNMPTISPVKSKAETANKPELRLEELFPEEIKLKEPLQNLGIPEKTPLSKTKEIPDTNFLQRKKIIQMAGEEYNLHIRTQIIPKLGTYPTELFVRIELKIIASGKIIEYKVIAKSGSPSFDRAAELAVRNAILDPLPPALAKNPPYIVLIRIVPHN
jgi:hypothetical protein